VIVLARALDKLRLEVAAHRCKDRCPVADRQRGELAAPVFLDEDQVCMTRRNDVPPSTDFLVAAPETDQQALRVIARGFRYKLEPLSEQETLFR